MTKNQLKAAKIQNTKDYKALNEHYLTARRIYKTDPKRGLTQPYSWYLGEKITSKVLHEWEKELKALQMVRTALDVIKPTN